MAGWRFDFDRVGCGQAVVMAAIVAGFANRSRPPLRRAVSAPLCPCRWR